MISGNLSRQELAEKEAKFKVGGRGCVPLAMAHWGAVSDGCEPWLHVHRDNLCWHL